MSLKLLERLEKDTRKEPAKPWKELVVDGNKVHQAGATEYPDGSFPRKVREDAQKSLYFFGKAVIGRKYLSRSLHMPIMEWLQQRVPFRKLLLIPRNHAKTSMVSHCLPGHIFIQDPDTNIYFPGHNGTEARIMLACETEDRAAKHVRVNEDIFEGNKLFRALFADKVWENPRRQAKKWNELEMILPRANEYPESSLFGVGVGKAVTGARPNVIIKDDLISLAARNSDAVMSTAIEWHVASRALLDEYEESTGLNALEFIIGTRWAIYDLYSYIVDGDLSDGIGGDPTVEVIVRSIVEDGKTIWPERFSLDDVAQLKREFKSLFPLLYMNDAMNPELVSFDTSLLRNFVIDGEEIVFETDQMDIVLAERWKAKDTHHPLPKGMSLTPDLMDLYLGKGRTEYLRLRNV